MVVGGCDRLVGFTRVLVEVVEQLLAGRRFKGRILAGLDFKKFDLHNVRHAVREFGHMAGEAVELPGLGVGLIIEAILGNAFKHLACVGHLLIELGQQHVANRHLELQKPQ